MISDDLPIKHGDFNPQSLKIARRQVRASGVMPSYWAKWEEFWTIKKPDTIDTIGILMIFDDFCSFLFTILMVFRPVAAGHGRFVCIEFSFTPSAV